MPDQEQHTTKRAAARRQAQLRRAKRSIMKWRSAGVAAFSLVMVLGGIIGLLGFARPTVSEYENRALTPFPEFSAGSFLDGSFFTGFSLWYADTYPLREPMVQANQAMGRLYGVSQSEAMVGGNTQADEVPVTSNLEDALQEIAAIEAPTDPPTERAVAEDIQANLMDGIYVKDGAGYSIYYFDQTAADTYIAAMNKAAERLDGTAKVYTLFAPASCIMLSPEESVAVGGTDQQLTLDYLRTRFDRRVTLVEPIDIMTEHNDEYLYFYTDHHWTETGAYYAYRKFCEAKGVDPIALEDRRHVSLGELAGTYYDTLSSMGAVRQDTVEAYIPNGTNDMTYYADGEEVHTSVVNEDAVNWDEGAKYSAFIAGDQPLDVISNPAITDGSSCLVVKDSYGCAFVPLLVDHYQTVHVIDFRYTDKNISDYVIENGIQDVVFLTGMKIGLVQTVAETLLAEVS